MNRILGFSALSSLLTLTACASLPTGPAVLVLPGTGKSFEQFRADDYECRRYAYGQVGGTTPGSAAATSGVGSAALGTALGAASGAALGGGRGAAVGAGVGLLTGGLAGAGAASESGYAAQERYDMGYIQCMYAQGHRVPVPGRFSDAYSQQKPAVPANIPPPPPSR
jgi:outer membrane lipoprotein SlyB